MLPSDSRVVIEPSGLTIELLAVVSTAVAPESGGLFVPAASACTTASETVVPVPGFPISPLGSGTADVTPGSGSGDVGGNPVLEVSPACVAVAEWPRADAVAAVLSSGSGALTDTVPSE